MRMFQFPNIKCSHIHVYKQWPPRESKFDIQMHINIAPDETSETWMQQAQLSIEKTIKELTSILIRAGAQKVTIEPRIDDKKKWTICTTAACQDKSLTCCNQKRGEIKQNGENSTVSAS